MSVLDAQQVFKSTLKAMINEDYSISADIERDQNFLERALSKVDFSVVTDIYLLQSNLNVNIGKMVGYNNKISKCNTDMKIDPNKDISKAVVYHKKSPVTHQNLVGKRVLSL